MARHHYEKDRFDVVPDGLLRSRAHRTPARRGRGAIVFAWAALATGLLVAIGVFGLGVVNGTFSNLPFLTATGSVAPSTVPTPTPTMAASATINATLPITVLNGTKTAGLANAVGDLLVKQGWGGAAKGIGTRLSVATPNIQQTIVYYSKPADEGAARAMVISLRLGTIQLSNSYPQSPIVVIIGSDYKLP
jgi:hypothetical protein